ncbi:hypothetical protein VTO42DRAFT_1277 [Malbranchea cinnamomea]
MLFTNLEPGWANMLRFPLLSRVRWPRDRKVKRMRKGPRSVTPKMASKRRKRLRRCGPGPHSHCLISECTFFS